MFQRVRAKRAWLPILISTLAGLFVLGCRLNSNEHPVPYVPVDETVYLNSASAYDLQFVGGHIILPNHGHKGVIIYRRTAFEEANDFGVYDLCCPNHVDEACGVIEVVDGIYGRCSCDDQEFLLHDGAAMNGTTTWGLRPYQVDYDGISIRIRGM